ncbi:hypothetical protein ACVWW6_008768 [Bradyrhizobium sp. USDA 3311]
MIALGWSAVTSVFEIKRSRALERAEAALRVFDLRARNRRHTSALSGVPAEARRIICTSARVYDLAIVTQPQRGYDSHDNSIPFASPATLFFTGHTSSMALFRSDESGFARAAGAVRPARCTTRCRCYVKQTPSPSSRPPLRTRSRRKVPPPVWVSTLQSQDLLQRSSHSRHPGQRSAPAYRLRRTKASTCW